MSDDEEIQKTRPESDKAGSYRPQPVEPAHAQSAGSSPSDERPSTTGPSKSASGRNGGEDFAPHEHHLRRGHPTRVSRPEQVDQLEVALTDAFSRGDPAKAWELTRELLSLARGLAVEAAKARFQKNYGGPLCEHCEGLKAGPGVVATCFQVRQCYFANFKTSDLSAKQAGIIDFLTKGSDPT